MRTLREDMLNEIEDEEDTELTDEDIKAFILGIKRVALGEKKNRVKSEQEPVTQTLNG